MLKRRMMAVLLILILIVPVPSAMAWSDAGHRIVALIAYQKLKPATRAKVLQILKKHERFGEDFDLPDDLPSGSTAKNKWLFSQAAVWPDLMRDNPEFHRGNWHFINKPLFLSPADDAALSGTLTTNLKLIPPAGAGLATQDMNVIQAIKLCQQKLKDPATLAKHKAISLCWLFHLVGDVHQPCHSTALFSQKRFPKGDRGGNLVFITPGGKLHSKWDGLLGKELTFKKLLTQTSSIMTDDDLVDAAIAASASLNPDQWLDESKTTAEKFVYVSAILDGVRLGENIPEADLPHIAVPSSYAKTAAEVARKRVAEAGFRLAKLIEEMDL